MQHGRPTILIVETDPTTRSLYQRELGRSFTVWSCDSGLGAHAFIRNQPIQAVVLEPELAHEDGWQLAHMLHTLPATAALPLILCSVVDDRRRALACGAARYLIKPVLPLTLATTLWDILQLQP